MKLPDKLYDILKWVAIVCLPLLKEAIPALFSIWHIPYGQEIADTLNIIAIVIAGLIGVSTISYQQTKVKELEQIEYKQYEG